MRVLLGGLGEPIPLTALGGAFVDPDFPIQTFTMADGEDFPAGDYLALGYTNFECWCVGASGGRGGMDSAFITFLQYILTAPDPDETHFHDPYLTGWHDWSPIIMAFGGAGGGGGLHHVSGLLADLDSLVPVVVGEVGADAPNSYLNTAVPVTPNPPLPFGNPNTYYDLPHTEFLPPQDGEDGGASSFGGTVCRASGGTGGKKSAGGESLAPNNQAAHTWDAEGGDGGIGDSTTAGGGGAGSATTSNASDGSWDGTIGAGGGGGRGGAYVPSEPELWAQFVRLASSGGQGSFAFGDTSVYGPRGSKASSSGKTIVPGAGGGAKPIPGVKAGSYATDFDPNGAVIVRVSKVTE
jgi:hypothetical protein